MKKKIIKKMKKPSREINKCKTKLKNEKRQIKLTSSPTNR